MPKLRHYDNEGTARFVTFGCYRNIPGLTHDLAKRLFLEELDRTREKHGFRLLAYVVMPEHVHLVLHPPDGMPLGLVVREMKSCSARRYFARERNGRTGEKRVFWQKRCYDHNCRTPETTIEKIRYCHNNPVQRGLVSEPGDWIWSSYNCYHGVEDVPLMVDKYEM
ncbi:MAG: transposase [candidate division Zixibacteria bacterium]|nr:transposase [candidate division Zixibacteria bacterium]MCD6249506.1 transposase [candidate division Zixibacteria bacterium]